MPTPCPPPKPEGRGAPCAPRQTLTSLARPLRILHELCKSLGLNLTKFTQYDENTWTEVSNVKLRNYVVEKMPEKLGYKLHPREKGRAPEEIYQMALDKVGAPASPAARPPALACTLPCPVTPRLPPGPPSSRLPGLASFSLSPASGLPSLARPPSVSP